VSRNTISHTRGRGTSLLALLVCAAGLTGFAAGTTIAVLALTAAGVGDPSILTLPLEVAALPPAVTAGAAIATASPGVTLIGLALTIAGQ
jgi:hypothetical protein